LLTAKLFTFLALGEPLVNLETAKPVRQHAAFAVVVWLSRGWFKLHPFVLEAVVLGRSNDDANDDLLGIFGEDLERHSIPHVLSDPNPPSWFFFRREKSFIRV
jgi:hypothetical protein